MTRHSFDANLWIGISLFAHGFTYGQWALNRLRFKRLPTRPMEKIDLDGSSLTIDNIALKLTSKLDAIDPNSVVQLKIKGDVHPDVLHKIYCRKKLFIYLEVRKWLYLNADIPIPERGIDVLMMH